MSPWLNWRRTERGGRGAVMGGEWRGGCQARGFVRMRLGLPGVACQEFRVLGRHQGRHGSCIAEVPRCQGPSSLPLIIHSRVASRHLDAVRLHKVEFGLCYTVHKLHTQRKCSPCLPAAYCPCCKCRTKFLCRPEALPVIV